MKQIVVILAIVAALAGCSEDKIAAPKPEPEPPRLEITYVADTYRTWGGCGSTTNRGHGTIKNVGGKDAINCYIRVKAQCETYEMWTIPRSLAPGQFGEYITGGFNGPQSTVKVTAHCESCP